MKVNIALLNNPFWAVADQVEALTDIFAENKVEFRVSKELRHGFLNIIIENFDKEGLEKIHKFCLKSDEKVAVLMTEHIDFIGGRFFFHGKRLHETEGYLGHHARRRRLLGLVNLRNCIFCFIRIGDLPELQNLDACFTEVPIYRFNFAQIDSPSNRLSESKLAPAQSYDCAFAGNLTEHRTQVLKDIEARIRLVKTTGTLSRKRRNDVYLSAKFILNIPQNNEWPWVSSMRIYAGLKSGRPLINFTVSNLVGENGSVPLAAKNVDDLVHLLSQLDYTETAKNQVVAFNEVTQKSVGATPPRNILRQYMLLYL